MNSAERDFEAAESWMLREIREQPFTLEATLALYVQGNAFREEAVAPARAWLRKQRGLLIAGSGSSRHAGLVGEVLLEEACQLPVDVEFASEYGYRKAQLQPGIGVIAISQSGETADTLAALRKTRGEGRATLAITNVASSTMAREADVSLPTAAGREQAIPATKSFTAQLLMMELLALLAGQTHGTLSEAALEGRLRELAALPELLGSQLSGWEAGVRELTPRYAEGQSFLFLGRGLHYPIAREGALKLKESAYVPAEGLPAGELKHGPNALVGTETPLVVLATMDPASVDSAARHEKIVHLMRDMRAQGADMLVVGNEDDEEARELVTAFVPVKSCAEPLLAITEIVPLQMFACFMAQARGIDVDRPRNLVKAVVTE